MKTRTPWAMAATLTLLLVVLTPLSAAAPSQLVAQVHPAIWEALKSEGEVQILVLLRQQADLSGADVLPTKAEKGRYVYETLWTLAQETQRGLRFALETKGVEYQSFYIVNAIKTRADSALVRSLAGRQDVAKILPDPRIQGVPPNMLESSTETLPGALAQITRATDAIEENLIRVNADDVWSLGFTGQGIVVGGQDTGYDWDHPALMTQYRGWDGATANHDYNWHDAIHEATGNPCGFDSPVPCDDFGHGTHTMGIMVGDDGGTHQIGMAPGAQWIGCRNMDEGVGTPTTYMECFEFFLAPYPLDGTPATGEPSLAPHVVNNSWSCPESEGCDEAAIAQMETSVDALRQAGIVVVVSAGNYGPTCGTVQYPPAIYPQSMTVGNFDHRTDTIHYRSSRGPVIYEDVTYTQPEISAPGVSINSSLPDGAYGALTGTSMAGPHVAGAVALLLSAAPDHSGNVDGIENLLLGSAEPMTTTETCGGDGPDDVPNNTWGWGILDVLGAVKDGALVYDAYLPLIFRAR